MSIWEKFTWKSAKTKRYEAELERQREEENRRAQELAAQRAIEEHRRIRERERAERRQEDLRRFYERSNATYRSFNDGPTADPLDAYRYAFTNYVTYDDVSQPDMRFANSQGSIYQQPVTLGQEHGVTFVSPANYGYLTGGISLFDMLKPKKVKKNHLPDWF